MKKLLVILSMVLSASLAFAFPHIGSDPNPGAESHRIVTDDGYDLTVPALADGSAYIDFALFSTGWHHGRVYSCETAVVIDETTSAESTLLVCETVGAPISFKVPNGNSNSNYKVVE